MRLAAERRQLAEVAMIKNIERIAVNGAEVGELEIGHGGEATTRG